MVARERRASGDHEAFGLEDRRDSSDRGFKFIPSMFRARIISRGARGACGVAQDVAGKMIFALLNAIVFVGHGAILRIPKISVANEILLKLQRFRMRISLSGPTMMLLSRQQ